jgi:hypothetical protein
MLRDFFLNAQPPLLGEEGKFATPLFGQQPLSAVAFALTSLRGSQGRAIFLMMSWTVGSERIGSAPGRDIQKCPDADAIARSMTTAVVARKLVCLIKIVPPQTSCAKSCS